MRLIVFLISCAFTLCLQAQDFVVGGQAISTTTNNTKYDSLSNFYLGPETENARPWIGQKFTYYNTLNYTRAYLQIPYPWKDGRLREGRYISSQAAKDAYLTDLKKKSGTRFTLTDIVKHEGTPGYVFTDENGESIFYSNLMFVGAEFICEGYKEKFRQTYVGKDVYFTKKGMRQDWNPNDVSEVSRCFVNLNSRELLPSLPDNSKWTVKGLGVDTTYWGNRTEMNDYYNSFCRLVFVVHNDKMGDYECFVDYSNMLGKSSLNPRFIIAESKISKPQHWGKDIQTQSWNGTIPSDVLQSANQNDPDAMYAIIAYFNVYGHFNVINNFSFEDNEKLLNKAINNGYIHHKTPEWLYRIASYYLPIVVKKDNNERNDYKNGTPYLIMAARMGNSSAVNKLIEVIEYGKSDDKEAVSVLEEVADKYDEAKLFLGRYMIAGKIVSQPTKIVTMLESLENAGNLDNASEAQLLLSTCYNQGLGVNKNSDKALTLLQKSAERKNVTACLKLGEMYYLGSDVEKNLDKAIEYLERGIELEYSADAKYYFMLASILASRSEPICKYYFERAFYTGNYEAAIELGNLYHQGVIIEKNEGEAAEYFWLAYKKGGLSKGKALFDKYQMKNILIQYLTEQESVGNRREDYVKDMINSLE